MKKSTIGVSRPLTAQTIGNAWEEAVFFGPQGLGRQANPAILASHVGPQTLPPSADLRSTGVQALAGFESLTLLMQGDLQIRDSAGTDLSLQAGDALWQGAGRGLLSEARIGPRLQAEGGTLALLRLGINLPATHKQIEPHHQALPARDIPTIDLPEGAGQLRVLAGEYQGQLGPAETVTPLQLWEVQLRSGHSITLPAQRGWYAVLLLLDGELRLPLWPSAVRGPQLALLDPHGDAIGIEAQQDSRLVLLSCEPIDEPIIARDALVMNTEEQLQACEARLASGEFGRL